MEDVAIAVNGLGKRYERGASLKGSNSLREMIQGAMANLGRGRRSRSESFWALRDASFTIRRGENVGIIGLNGAGKSTLLKVLSRIVTPTTGTARIVGRMGALLEVGTGFHQELTGRENTYLYGSILGMTREEVERKFDDIVEFSEIGDFIDTPVKRYSSGMYVRLAFAVAAHLDPDILLLDEVLAVGDFTFQRKCMDFARKLETKGSTILFVSHNMFSIKTMCSRVIYLKKGQVVFDGPTDDGLRLYEDDSRLATPAWFTEDVADRRISVTGVTIHDESGTEKTVFTFGERMIIRVRYEARGPIDAPNFLISFTRADDVLCCNFSSVGDAAGIPRAVGSGIVELTTPPLTLVSEMYRVGVTIREREHAKIVCAQIGGSFHVSHPTFDSNAYGVFHEAGRWRHDPIASLTP